MKFSKHPLRSSEDPAMSPSYRITTLRAVVVLFVAGCASSPVAPPDAPAALRPPPGQSPFLEAFATGVQIYECAAKSGEPSAFAWIFRAPEAPLTDRSGRSIGKHYAGPTWESFDGSIVVGEIASRDPGPDKSAIPWLLLTAKATSGTGELSSTKSIQRIRTTGGLAPSQPCSPDNAKQVVRVPYTATYYFYHAAS